MGEVFHQATKGLVPVFYKANERIAQKLGTPEAFQKEFVRINEQASIGKATQSELFFLAQVSSMARDLGIKSEIIVTGSKRIHI